MDDALARYLLGQIDSRPPLDRAPVYRSLVHGSLKNAILGEFPATELVLGDSEFERLVLAFLHAGGPTTSLYRDIPGEFVSWVIETEHPLADLMQWEWLETVAARHPADLDAIAPIDPDLVRPNPTLQIAVYQRPVDEMDDETPDPPAFDAPVAYLVWRKPKTDETEHFRVGLLVARALALANETPMTIHAMAERLVSEVAGLGAGQVEAALNEACAALRLRNGII